MVIYTIGYEGRDFADVLRALRRDSIEVLVDVRALPLSRKPAFSKRKLSSLLEVNGIRYEHIGVLGDPKPGRDAAREGRFSDFRRIYRSHLSKVVCRKAIANLVDLCRAETCCLMCFEADPLHCHRSMIADRLAWTGLTVCHLRGDATTRYGSSSRQSCHPSEGIAAA